MRGESPEALGVFEVLSGGGHGKCVFEDVRVGSGGLGGDLCYLSEGVRWDVGYVRGSGVVWREWGRWLVFDLCQVI